MSTWRPAEERGPRPIGEVLGAVGRKLGAPRVVESSAVVGRWPDIVGQAVADHARAVSVRDATLLVEVDDPSWATQMKLLSADVVRRIGEVVGEGLVAQIEVRVARPKRARNSP